MNNMDQLGAMRSEYVRLEEKARKSLREGEANQLRLTFSTFLNELRQFEAIGEKLIAGKEFDPVFLGKLIEGFLLKFSEIGANRIGIIGEHVVFDPKMHSKLPSSGEIVSGSLVEVISVGYYFTNEYDEDEIFQALVKLVE